MHKLYLFKYDKGSFCRACQFTENARKLFTNFAVMVKKMPYFIKEASMYYNFIICLNVSIRSTKLIKMNNIQFRKKGP